MEDDNNTASKLIANDEIKEILRILRRCTYGNEVYLIKEHGATLLLDYITNLQQENQELNDSVTWWTNRFNAVQRDYEDYKSRIEKAVEYIKEHIRIDDEYPDYMEMLIEEKDELLNILNGRSDE